MEIGRFETKRKTVQGEEVEVSSWEAVKQHDGGPGRQGLFFFSTGGLTKGTGRQVAEFDEDHALLLRLEDKWISVGIEGEGSAEEWSEALVEAAQEIEEKLNQNVNV